MTASSRRLPSRNSLTAALLVWSFNPAFMAACGSGGDVDMGSLVLSGGVGGGGGGGPGLCGGQPCADHHGTRVFIEESAKALGADGFVTGNLNPTGTDPSREPALLYPNDETRRHGRSGLRRPEVDSRSAFALAFLRAVAGSALKYEISAWPSDAWEVKLSDRR